MLFRSLSNLKGVMVTTCGKLFDGKDYESCFKYFNSSLSRDKIFLVEHKVKDAVDNGFWREKNITLKNFITIILSKYISCVIAGGLVLALGELLFVFSLAFRFPLVSENSSALESYSHAADVYFISGPLIEGKYVAAFAIYAFLAFVFGALWSGVGITVSAFITDNYAASFSPFIIWFISSGALPDNLRTEVYLRGNYNFGGTAKSLAAAFVYFAAVTVLLGIVFCRKAGKRCQE